MHRFFWVLAALFPVGCMSPIQAQSAVDTVNKLAPEAIAVAGCSWSAVEDGVALKQTDAQIIAAIVQCGLTEAAAANWLTPAKVKIARVPGKLY